MNDKRTKKKSSQDVHSAQAAANDVELSSIPLYAIFGTDQPTRAESGGWLKFLDLRSNSIAEVLSFQSAAYLDRSQTLKNRGRIEHGDPQNELVEQVLLEKDTDFLIYYLDTLALLERLHRLLLDVITDEFERLGMLDINSVQALLLYNVGDSEVTAGELRTRGFYRGSNVSYNLKKLVEAGYMEHRKSSIDRRATIVRLTERGHGVRKIVGELFQRHAGAIKDAGGASVDSFVTVNDQLRRLESFWTSQIRYIY